MSKQTIRWADPKEAAAYWRERERHSLAKGFPVVAAQHRRRAEEASKEEGGN